MTDISAAGYKRCSKCGEARPREMFSPDKRKKDGSQAKCKLCCAADKQEWRKDNRGLELSRKRAHYAAHSEDLCEQKRARYRENPEPIREWVRQYRKRHPDRVRECGRNWRKANRESTALRERAWRANNRDRVRSNLRAWASSNPQKRREISNAAWHRRRARIANVGGRGITTSDFKAMIYVQQGLCAYCERDGQKLTLDHIIPLDQNGQHDPDNGCAACGVCNSSKNNRTPEQWAEAGRWFDPPRK